MHPTQLASLIDHTLLKPEATPAHIRQLCAEARQHAFYSVCVNPVYVTLCAAELRDSPVKICAVVGFPLGACHPAAKAHEARLAVEHGAHEVDMVLHVGALKAGDHSAVQQDIAVVVQAAHAGAARVKVILETCLLDEAEKIAACQIAQAAGADFVKTSTGFSSSGATVEDIALMRRVVGPNIGVKASGGIRTLADALRMIEAGANRLGASAGVKILSEL